MGDCKAENIEENSYSTAASFLSQKYVSGKDFTFINDGRYPSIHTLPSIECPMKSCSEDYEFVHEIQDYKEDKILHSNNRIIYFWF